MVENVIWPAYFDIDLSRSAGRRVSTDLAVEDPDVGEIARAVQQVGYDTVIKHDKTYPREYEPRGYVVVKGAEDSSKGDLLQATAAYLEAIRA